MHPLRRRFRMHLLHCKTPPAVRYQGGHRLRVQSPRVDALLLGCSPWLHLSLLHYLAEALFETLFRHSGHFRPNQLGSGFTYSNRESWGFSL